MSSHGDRASMERSRNSAFHWVPRAGKRLAGGQGHREGAGLARRSDTCKGQEDRLVCSRNHRARVLAGEGRECLAKGAWPSFSKPAIFFSFFFIEIE